MKVLWTDAAIDQLEAIHDFVAQTLPEYAQRVVDRITARSKQIAAFPFSGQAVPGAHLAGSARILACMSAKHEKERVITLKLK